MEELTILSLTDLSVLRQITFKKAYTFNSLNEAIDQRNKDAHKLLSLIDKELEKRYSLYIMLSKTI